jgi:hypothetical protein
VLIGRSTKGGRPAANRIAQDTLQRMHAPTPDHPSKADDLTFIAYRLQR